MSMDNSYIMFKNPWKLIYEDEMDQSLAEAYLRKICFNDGSLLSDADKALSDIEILDKLQEQLGGRLITILEDISNLMQQRMMALDFATECLNVEQQYLRKLAKNTNKLSDNHAHSDAVKSVVNDSKNALNFDKLKNLADKDERTRRVNWIIVVMCLNHICNNSTTETLTHNMIMNIKGVIANYSLVTIADVTKPLNSNIYSDKNYQIFLQLVSGPLREECSYDEVKAMFEAEFAVNPYEQDQISSSNSITFNSLRELQLEYHFNRDDTEPSYIMHTGKRIWLKELRDTLVDKIQLIMKLIEDNHKSFVVCECCQEEYELDPENKELWQPADDMFYLRYWSPDGRLNDTQQYTLAAPMIELARLHVEGALIHPKRCKFCNRIMLPTAGFISSVALAASVSEIKGGGQLSQDERPDSDVICNHTAEAIAQKLVMRDAVLANLTKNQSDVQVSEYRYIDWPSVVCRPTDTVQHSNIFTEQAYKSYFDSLTLAGNQSADEQSLNDIVKLIEFIMSADSYAGYTYTDYLCSLIDKKHSVKYPIERLLLLCKIVYDSELEISFIEQVYNAYNSPIFNSNLHDLNGTEKFDMSFGYENIQECIKQITPPTDVCQLMGFSSFEELLSAMGVPKDFILTVPDVDCALLNTTTNSKDVLQVLTDIKQFYLNLLTVAQVMRTDFFKKISAYQDDYDEYLREDDSNWMHAAWVSQAFSETPLQLSFELINSSAGLAEFINCIDTDLYISALKQTAINLYNYGRSDKEKITDLEDAVIAPVDRTIASAADKYVHTVYTTSESLRNHIHKITLGSINVDSAGLWPSIDCLHTRLSVSRDAVYETLSATYINAFMQEPEGGVEVSEAAEYAILVYYCCAVDDPISKRIKEAIAPIISEQLKSSL